MPALNIPAVANAALGTAWGLITSVLTDSTLTDGPTVLTRDVTTEEETGTHEFDFNLKAFFWDEKEEQNEMGDQAARDAALRVEKRMALVRVVDCPGMVKPSTLAKITEGATVWNVLKAEAPPGQAIFILTLRR